MDTIERITRDIVSRIWVWWESKGRGLASDWCRNLRKLVREVRGRE